jgi:glucose/arabinose dehydrogenase
MLHLPRTASKIGALKFLPVLAAAAFVGVTPRPVFSQTAPPGFFIEDAFPTASFSLPSLIVFVPDGRRLVVEKEGRVWVVTAGGVKLSTPFIDLSVKVLSNDDRGLHGVVFDPDFPASRWVYLLYTADPDSDGADVNVGAFGRLERYQTSVGNPDVLDLATRQILIGATWESGIPEPPSNRHHMVATLRVAQDKTLLIGSGDAANADGVDTGGWDPPSSFGPGRTDPAEDIGAFRARTLNSMDGKILRVDKETGHGLASNPYWDGNPVSDRSRVWAYGLRNPFRFSIRPGTGSTDPAAGQPGVLYIGDVGWNTTEELSIAKEGGLNFGWPCFEGAYGQPGYQAATSTFYPNPNVLCPADTSAENPRSETAPALWWDHGNGANSNPAGWVGNCSIGGAFYTGTSYPVAYRGAYYVADYGLGWIRRIQVDANDNVVATDTFIEGAGGVVDVEADPVTGDLYYIDINTNSLRRIRYSSGNLPPVVNASVDPAAGYVPLTVTAIASGSTDPEDDPLTYLWDFGDGGISHSADTTYTYTTPGAYQATVTVSDGNGGSSLAAFDVVAGQVPPPGSIVAPPDSSTFLQNEPLALLATQVDTTQGPATYRWDIDLHHNNHVHPAAETYYGLSTSFLPSTPNDGEAYHLRIRLSVTQGALTALDSVSVWPRLNLVPVSISFNPAVPLGGAPIQVIARVRSIGEVGSSESAFEVREGAVVLASGTLAPIPDGDSLDVVVPIGSLPLGAHAIEFVADSADDQFETDETDNAITGTVTVGGLVAAYGFDEGVGPVVTDASGHGLTGTIQGATWITGGRYGGALSFDGASSYVNLGNPSLLHLTGSLTLSAWVKAATNPVDDGQIIAKSGDVSGWQLKTSPDTGVHTFGMAVSGGPGSYTARHSATVRSLDAWYYVAGVYDAASQTLDTYVNGDLDNGVLLGTIPASQYDPALDVNIGRRLGGFHFSGVIDEIRVYSRALSPAEIQADMNTPVASTGIVGVPEIVPEGPPPAGYELSQTYPNPFNPRTTVRYVIPRQERVRLEVFTVAGELVAVLVDQVQPAGPHEVAFEPKGIASGLYFCRMRAGSFKAGTKLFYLR